MVFDPTGIGRDIVSFDKLIINEEAGRGLLLFRLLESASTLIIHERVKAELDKESLRFVSVHRPDEPLTPLDLDELDDGKAGGDNAP
ncbi:hypothetical protein [Pyxidicoccus caerfyrddinensis]|uniref:hypothetical protein n=1 Tax=Pyxidicoccus caerfyrddinensis TaxID=2709663 RepID=UPI0013D9F5CE|nr:hypothetical protein [Pyxidicoccus caerfyrddinensis]